MSCHWSCLGVCHIIGLASVCVCVCVSCLRSCLGVCLAASLVLVCFLLLVFSPSVSCRWSCLGVSYCWSCLSLCNLLVLCRCFIVLIVITVGLSVSLVGLVSVFLSSCCRPSLSVSFHGHAVDPFPSCPVAVLCRCIYRLVVGPLSACPVAVLCKCIYRLVVGPLSACPVALLCKCISSCCNPSLGASFWRSCVGVGLVGLVTVTLLSCWSCVPIFMCVQTKAKRNNDLF